MLSVTLASLGGGRWNEVTKETLRTTSQDLGRFREVSEDQDGLAGPAPLGLERQEEGRAAAALPNGLSPLDEARWKNGLLAFASSADPVPHLGGLAA